MYATHFIITMSEFRSLLDVRQSLHSEIKYFPYLECVSTSYLFN